MTAEMRTFEGGATRNSSEKKLDYEGFYSPVVMEAYAEYMHSHRKQADGKMRDGDNWQRGITLKAYMKSLTRHFMDMWLMYRGYPRKNPDTGERWTMKCLCCAIMFNVQGFLFEILKADPESTGYAESMDMSRDPEEEPKPDEGLDPITAESYIPGSVVLRMQVASEVSGDNMTLGVGTIIDVAATVPESGQRGSRIYKIYIPTQGGGGTSLDPEDPTEAAMCAELYKCAEALRGSEYELVVANVEPVE